jgi:hypothetical protein
LSDGNGHGGMSAFDVRSYDVRRGLPIDTPRERPPSPRQVARWITTTPPRRGLHATEALRRLLEHCPELDQTHTPVRQFAAMVDARDAVRLPAWLDQLVASGLPALASLANAIREDQLAVVQGITTPFNSGVNEGRITDLKLRNARKSCQGQKSAQPLTGERAQWVMRRPRALVSPQTVDGAGRPGTSHATLMTTLPAV